MAIAPSENKKIDHALGSVLSRMHLQLPPAEMQKIQKAVSDTVAHTVAQEAGEEKSLYDLPRALDRFGQTRETGAPEIDTIAPEKLLSERGEPGGEAKKTPQRAPEAPEKAAAREEFKPFEEKTPAEQAAEPEAKKREGASSEGEETPEGEQAPSAKPIQERGGVTQAVNALRFRKELNQIDKQLKELTKRRKVLGKEVQKQERALAPYLRRKRLIENSIRLLRIIKAILWGLGALLALFGIGEAIAAAAVYLGRVIRVAKERLEALKKQMKPFEDRVKAARDKAAAVEKETRALARHAVTLRNASLLQPALAA